MTILRSVRYQLRRGWAVLTSMRTALILLFLLAVAAVPGAAFPQRDLNPEKVTQYYRDHPKLAPIVEKLSGFDVFAAPWFAAIYLLLFISLLGCLTSRLPVYARLLFVGPPAAPKRLDRLPHHATLGDRGAQPEVVASELKIALRKKRWRRFTIREEPGGGIAISTEKGYLREAGNLLFHLSLVAVLIGVAIGALWGWSGGMLIVEGSTVCNTVQSYDQYKPGKLVQDKALPPLCLQLDDFRASYEKDGQPTQYEADVRYADGDNAAVKDLRSRYTIEVNKPLRFTGAGMFLLNHGYAPILRYTDKFGTVFESPTPFLPQDKNITSEGVVVLPDANQNPDGGKRISDVQMAFEGIYMPTTPTDGPPVRSEYPDRSDEGITLLAYRGDTGMNAGIPRSVYTLDQSQIQKGALKPIGSKLLRPGDSWALDDGSTVEFLGSQEWMSVQITDDPGEYITLGGAVGMVLGLLVSLLLRRRRLFVRISLSDRGSRILVGGLARSGLDSYEKEFSDIARGLSAHLDTRNHPRLDTALLDSSKSNPPRDEQPQLAATAKK